MKHNGKAYMLRKEQIMSNKPVEDSNQVQRNVSCDYCGDEKKIRYYYTVDDFRLMECPRCTNPKNWELIKKLDFDILDRL